MYFNWALVVTVGYCLFNCCVTLLALFVCLPLDSCCFVCCSLCGLFVCWWGFLFVWFVYLLLCLDWCVCSLVLVISVMPFICGFLPFTYSLLVLTLLGFCLPNSVGFCYSRLRFWVGVGVFVTFVVCLLFFVVFGLLMFIVD